MLLPIAMMLSTPAQLPDLAPPFSEPQPGYLEKFEWKGAVPTDAQRAGDRNPITEEVVQAMKEKGIPGAAVVVTEDDKFVYARGFGYANLSTKQKFTATTPSRCGSISKTATALAVLKLVDQGKFSLDDQALPLLARPGRPYNYGPRVKEWSQIRVRDLLDQVSGLPGNSVYLTGHAMAKKAGKPMRLTLDDLFQDSLKNQTLTSIGDKWAYTNLNFELLSLLIERQTKKPFATALKDLVVAPLGIEPDQMFLSPTRSIPPDRNEARCYQKSTQMLESIYQEGEMVPEAYGGLDGDILSGAGHVAFSATAIAKMMTALRTRPTSYLKESVWNEVITPPAHIGKPGVPFTKTNFYSKGTNVTVYPDGTYGFAHGAMLMHASGNYLPYKPKIQFVVLSNCNMEAGKTLSDVILLQAVRKGLAAWGK
ncbi:MAG: serine hydrolase domain-containing protein [Fimbriimonas sp.]